MHKRLAIGLSLAAACLSLISLALSRNEDDKRIAGLSRRLFPFPWREATSVRLERADGIEFFVKSADGWRVRLPGGGNDVLAREAEEALAALAALAWREPLAASGARRKGEGGRLGLTVAAADGQILELRLGGVADNVRAVMASEGGTTVYGVNREFFNFMDWPAERFREFSLLPAEFGSRLTEIAISPAGGNPELRLRLRRGEVGWRLEEPISWPADETRLDLLIRWADKLRAEAVEAEATDDLGEFGLGPDAAYVETVRAGPDGVKRDRAIFGGKTPDGRLYAKVEGRSPIFAVPAGTPAEISLDAAAAYPKVWRDFYRRRSINLAGGELPSEIVIEKLLPLPIRLILKAGGDGGWTGRLEENGMRREFPVEPPDPDPAESRRPLNLILTGLSSLRVQSFISDSPLAPGGLESGFPAWRFYCRGPSGEVLPTLTLYAPESGGVLPPGDPFPEGSANPAEYGSARRPSVAFSVSDQPTLMEAAGEIVYLLCSPPYRYQSRRLADDDPEKWDKVEITVGKERHAFLREPNRRNEQWWREGEPPEPLRDDNNAFILLLLELSRLWAEGWIADAGAKAADFGLDLPEITAIVYGNRGSATGAGNEADERRFKLSLGDAVGGAEGARFARLDDSGPVFLVSGDLAASLAKNYR